MDALSNVKTCQLLSFRLAPIQISWLGGDSPGLPTIDYFFVDPYLLDETAQADYEEQLVRLPSFVGIDSFGVRDIDLLQFRRHLQIPDDAVIYLTAAAGWKRHPDCLRWQLEILRQVPNGYLIVKGVSDLQTVGEAFQQTACEFGVSDRIRLLALTFTVEEHRAQVGVADVILDTFPYTGATHSLEALWRGVPIVTRVGQHYYSRMTYALLKSIGIEVGIAGSEDEYINWGVSLGREPELLQAVKQQIRESYQTAPIWNSRRFARSLELFYQRIWQTHQTSLAGKLMQPAVELDTISDITEIGWQSWSADSNLTLADREFILSEFQQSHPASSAYQWNQLGLRQLLLAYQVGSSWQKQKYFEAALECFQVGLLYDSEHVPCWFNSLQVSMLLGDRHNSLRQAVKLLRFLQFISPARLEQMRGLVWGAPPVTSQDSNPSLRQKTYLKYLSLWLGQHASVVYRAEAQRFWRLLLDIDPSNKQACLIVAVALLREQRIEGIFHLQQLLASNPDYLPASIALDIGKQMVGEQQSNLVSLPYEGFSLTVEPTLFSIVTTVLLTQGQWFEAEIEFCRQFLAPGMSVIDVGANVGVYTFLAARCVGETGKVFAVEPTPTCVTCLESTISRNALGMQVKTIAAAAGESDGQVSFAMEAASVFNRVVTDAETTESFTVRQITLDNLWEMEGRPPIDLLKVDAEGAELATFRGAEQLLRTAVPVVLFENLHGLEAKGAASAEYLSELGYQFYIYRPAIGDLQPTNWQADAATSLNIIAITPQRRSQLEQAGRVSFANDDR
jgi:FkbM family methyltransferase